MSSGSWHSTLQRVKTPQPSLQLHWPAAMPMRLSNGHQGAG